MESLKVSNLCKTYIIEKRQNNVLRNVNLEIEQGEMVAVMGALRFRQNDPSLYSQRHGQCHCGQGGFLWTGDDRAYCK